jgi:hypothetical protein
MKQGYKIFSLSGYLIPGWETKEINPTGHLAKKKELGHTLTNGLYKYIYKRVWRYCFRPGVIGSSTRGERTRAGAMPDRGAKDHQKATQGETEHHDSTARSTHGGRDRARTEKGIGTHYPPST